MPVRSKTNQWFIGALKMDMHFSPDEVEAERRATIDLETDI